jgi:hypothetical protein
VLASETGMPPPPHAARVVLPTGRGTFTFSASFVLDLALGRVGRADKIYALGPLLSQLCGYHLVHRSDVALLPGVTAFVIKVNTLPHTHDQWGPTDFFDCMDYRGGRSVSSTTG